MNSKLPSSVMYWFLLFLCKCIYFSTFSFTPPKKGIGLRRSGDSTSYLSSASKNEEIEVKRKLVQEIKKGEEMQKELRLQVCTNKTCI